MVGERGFDLDPWSRKQRNSAKVLIFQSMEWCSTAQTHVIPARAASYFLMVPGVGAPNQGQVTDTLQAVLETQFPDFP